MSPHRWDPSDLIARFPITAWGGSAWRIHIQVYPVTDPGGSLLFSGRYHRGGDLFPLPQVWPALYLALRPEVSLGEVMRHVSSEGQLRRLNDFVLSEVTVELAAVLDLRRAVGSELTLDDLCADLDYRPTQDLAARAIAAGAEAILVPSCTLLGDNLVIFPRQLRATSTLTPGESRSFRLYIERGA